MKLLDRLFHVEPRRSFVCERCGITQSFDTHEACEIGWDLHRRWCIMRGRKLQQVSRRRFLFLGAAAGVTLAVAPAIALAPQDPFPEFWYRQQFYQGGLRVGKRALYARIQLTGPMIAASVTRPGAFMTAKNRELQAIAEDIQRQEERCMLRAGRSVLWR